MARKQKNPYLGQMDKGLQIFQKIVHAVIDAGGGEEDFDRFLTGKTEATTIAGSFMAWRKKLVKIVQQATSLLTLVSSTIIPATAEPFHAKKKIVKDISDKAVPKISYIGDNVKAWFLKGDGLIEAPMGESTLYYHKLERSSQDGPIIEALGGKDKAISTFAQIHALMTNQPNGEKGVLLTNGYVNIFYLKDVNGVLRTVSVYWYVDDWHVYAFPVEYQLEWHDGSQVFSGNSVLIPLEPVAVA